MRSGEDLNEGEAVGHEYPFSHRPGEGLIDCGFCWTFDGEVVPDEIWQAIYSADEELSEETELAFVAYWVAHEPDGLALYDRWLELWGEHHELERRLNRYRDSRATSERLEALAIEGQLHAIESRLAWITDGMEAVLEGRPPPPEPEEAESVKVADLFGTVIDTHLAESQLRAPLARQKRRR